MAEDHIDIYKLISRVFKKVFTKAGKREFFRHLVHELLQDAGYKFKLASPAPVEKVRVLLGINLSLSNKLSTDGRSTVWRNDCDIEVPRSQLYSDGLHEWLTDRGRFSLGHEIAHFIIYNIFENSPEIANYFNLSEGNIEHLCDFVATELLFPSRLVYNTSLEDFIKVAKYKPTSSYNESFTEGAFLLQTKLLEAMRKLLRVSRIVLVRRLDRSRILDEAQSGVIISIFSANRNTGRSAALRVYKASVPSWGFIPHNIRLSTIGLKSAVNAYNSLGYGIVRKWKEEIKVSEKVNASKSGKWKSRYIESWGEHVSYPLRERQNYLMTTFKWPKPNL